MDASLEVPSQYQEVLRGFTELKDVELRQKWELHQNVFVAESASVIDRAWEDGLTPLAFLLTTKWQARFQEKLQILTGASDGGDIPVFVLDEDDSESLTGFRVHRGALAIFERPQLPSATDLLSRFSDDDGSYIVVIEGVVNHTNMGAIFRSAAALGAKAVLLDKTCTDPLYRRSIRVSMGGVFQVPWTRLDKWPDPDLFHRFGYECWALTPSASTVDLDEAMAALELERPTQKLALCLGSEGPGLTHKALCSSDKRVAIPLSQQVDSLNVATAATVAFWEAQKHQRRLIKRIQDTL